jgi:hypothetical protein
MYLRIGSSCGAEAGTLGGDRSWRRKIGSSSGCGAGPGGGRRGTTPLPLVAPLTGAVDALESVGGGACAGTAGGGLAGAEKPVGALKSDDVGGSAGAVGSL